MTGGSRGIGRAAALLLARAGADVALTYHTRAERRTTTAAGDSVPGAAGVVSGGDLADPAAADQLAATGRDASWAGWTSSSPTPGCGPLRRCRSAQLSVDRWRSTLQANLDSVFLSTRAVLPLMRAGGRVVIVSSTAGSAARHFTADYAATKGALISLTKSLAVEYAPAITVNCVAPGWVDTEMSARAFTPENRERIERTIPVGRIATAEDVAGPILFLCSALARHITGEVLNVNGGSVLCG